MATVEKMPMLQEGYDRLTADLKRLKAERPLIVDAIEEARANAARNAAAHLSCCTRATRTWNVSAPCPVCAVCLAASMCGCDACSVLVQTTAHM